MIALANVSGAFLFGTFVGWWLRHRVRPTRARLRFYPDLNGETLFAVVEHGAMVGMMIEIILEGTGD